MSKQPEPIAVLRGHEHEIHSLHFIDSNQLLSGYYYYYYYIYVSHTHIIIINIIRDSNGFILLWTLKTRRPQIKRKLHSKGILSLDSNQSMILT
jgi:hypothetical protein